MHQEIQGFRNHDFKDLHMAICTYFGAPIPNLRAKLKLKLEELYFNKLLQIVTALNKSWIYIFQIYQGF